jgi:hypothetical protein
MRSATTRIKFLNIILICIVVLFIYVVITKHYQSVINDDDDDDESESELYGNIDYLEDLAKYAGLYDNKTALSIESLR